MYLLKKVLLAFGTLLLTQILFYAANTTIFHVGSAGEWLGIVWGNIVFGFATIATILLPYIALTALPVKARWNRWYRIVSEILYVVPILIIVVANCSNTAYYQFTFRLLTADIFDYLGVGGQMGTLLPIFAIDYWYAWVFAVVIMVLFFIANSNIKLLPQRRFGQHTAADATMFATIALITLLLVRGGITHRLQLADATRYCQPKNAALVDNDAYSILRTIGKPTVGSVNYMSNEQANQLFDPTFVPAAKPSTDTLHTAPRPNIVIIVLESFAQEYMGCYNNGVLPSYTPFLDSLATQSVVYQGRANSKKSIEGITAITSSVPTLSSTAFTQTPAGKAYTTGLPGLLKPSGYHSGFFHGGYNGTMDFDKYCKQVGFDDYFGKNEYEADVHTGNDYDGAWGIFDGPFFDFTLRKLDSYKQPFLAEIFTVTSHHPYPIPDNVKELFAEGPHPILKCVAYTDYCLRQFFAQARHADWYENTLFVIVGDHSGPNITPIYNDYEGWYSIPMMFFSPKNMQGREDERIMQQVDILPTILDILEIDTTCTSFGTSLLRSPNHGRFVAFGNNYALMVTNAPDGSHTLTTLPTKGSDNTPQTDTLKALLQQYSNLFSDKKHYEKEN